MGFRTDVVLLAVDAQCVGQQAGADVVLGDWSAPSFSREFEPRTDQAKAGDREVFKRIPAPPFPPGGGGGGAPALSWDWGKPFTPVSPRPKPGGVSTEEIARAFVDKGNWPVRTACTLLYLGTLAAAETR